MKKNKGITRVALVITIIVLLILAGVALSLIAGNEGILSKAETSVVKTKEASAKEQAELMLAEITADYYEARYVNKTESSDLSTYIKNAFGAGKATSNGEFFVTLADETVTVYEGSSSSGTKILTGSLGKNGEVTWDASTSGTTGGSGEGDNSGSGETTKNWAELVADLAANPSTYLAEATELGQTSTAAVGIGTDGEVVNLDMWQYYPTDDGEGLSLGDNLGCNAKYGYKPEYIQGGKIIGTVPQYIYIAEDNKVYPVTKMDGTFNYWYFGDMSEEAGALKEAPELPSTVTALRSTFTVASGLTSVKIPDSVTSIGESAFYGCTNLSTVTIGNNVTSIGYYAFYRCKSLSSINIPDSVTSIGYGAFWGCTGLSSINISSSVISIGNYAFDGCISLSSITIPSSVTSIENGAFSGCTNLSTVTIDSETIANGATYVLNNASTIYIKSGITLSEDSYIANNFTKVDSDKTGYAMYTYGKTVSCEDVGCETVGCETVGCETVSCE